MKYYKQIRSWGVEWCNYEGSRHRENGPAVITNSGDKAWFINGKLHREDGPAVIYKNGPTEWYLKSIKYSEKDYKREIIKRNLNKLNS